MINIDVSRPGARSGDLLGFEYLAVHYWQHFNSCWLLQVLLSRLDLLLESDIHLLLQAHLVLLPALLLIVKLAHLAVELAQLAPQLNHLLHRLTIARFVSRSLLLRLGQIER